MFRFVQACWADFTNALFPSTCLGCNQWLEANESLLCAACRLSLPETNQHQNKRNETALRKFAGRVPIAFVVSYLYFTKGGTVQRLIHHIKYKGRKEAAHTLGNWYGYQLKQSTDLPVNLDLLVGVPLHKSRLQQRGYNQADWIAQGLSESLGVPVRTDVLTRLRFLGSQTRRSRFERWQNVETVFAVANVEAVKNQRVALVDDVLTTGATLEACAQALLRAGCQSVGIITLAAAK